MESWFINPRLVMVYSFYVSTRVRAPAPFLRVALPVITA